MSVLTALYRTYNSALDNNMVDRTEFLNRQTVLLPVYHSSKKSNGSNDMIEVTISEKAKFIKAEWIPEGEIAIYPVTEESILRSGKRIAPHPLCDELSYLAKELEPQRHMEYERVRMDWVAFMEDEEFNLLLKVIDEYLRQETILTDCISSLFSYTNYEIIGNYNIVINKGEKKEKTIDLSKIFVTFSVETEKPDEPNISVSTDRAIHNNYINYVRQRNLQKPQQRCDISGDMTYCVIRHRGLLGNAKVISISENKETYFGRLDDGNEIVHIGYETSQKIHLMLKYLLENHQNYRKISKSCYLVNWFSNDISNDEKVSLLDSISPYGVIENEIYEDEDEEDDTPRTLGGSISEAINDYITGSNRKIAEGKFYVMIIEKSSNGRISIKYFRELYKSELYERIRQWYESTSWLFYESKTKRIIRATPSPFSYADAIFGTENNNGHLADKVFLNCKNKKLRAKTIERILLCILENRRFPYDLKNRMLHNLYNRNSYEKTWNYIISVACSIFKKYQIDYQMKEEVNEVLDTNIQTRSYLYGRLLATYEKLELDVINNRNSDNKNRRPTNAERFWNAFTRMPAKTLLTLEDKLKPYKDMLLKINNKAFIYYDRIIQDIMCKLRESENYEQEKNRALDEDFIFGYYAQKQEFYTKKENTDASE